MRSIEPQVRNCAPGNLEIPGSSLARRPGMTTMHAVIVEFSGVFRLAPRRLCG
jgi:hypothetical protein